MNAPLPPDQEEQAQQLAARLAEASRDDFLRMARLLVAAGETPFDGDTEFQLRDHALRLGVRALKVRLAEKNGRDGSSVTCPHCGQAAAAFHDDRGRTITSLCCTVRYQRAYYYCRRDGDGFCPADQQVGMGDRRLSPAGERVTALAGRAEAAVPVVGRAVASGRGILREERASDGVSGIRGGGLAHR